MKLKPFTTVEQQLSLIENKGFRINDWETARVFVTNVGYYRLRAYFLPFKTSSGYRPEDFSRIMQLYEFDAKLRAWLFEVIGEIECVIRARFSSYLARKYGPECHLDASTFDTDHKHEKYAARIKDVIQRNHTSPIIQHHQEKYGGHFPIWVIIEFFSVGMLSFTFSDLRRHDRKAIARLFHTGDNQLISWLKAFTELRNKCAHFARLYYWRFTSVPKKDRRMEKPVDRTLFSQIHMLKFLHQDAAKWNGHLQALASLMLCYEAAIDLEHIGFPTNWQDILTKR